MDEEQESSYKQEYPAPKYHAKEVALMRGRLHKAMVIMASATPSLESYYNKIKGKFTYHTLLNRYGGAKYPQVFVVDMIQDFECSECGFETEMEVPLSADFFWPKQ